MSESALRPKPVAAFSVRLLSDLPGLRSRLPRRLDCALDEVVWAYASENGYTIVTKDADRFWLVPKTSQRVEKVVVGPAGSSKTGSNTTKTGLKHLRNGVLGL